MDSLSFFFSDQPEIEYAADQSIHQRRRLGQIFTPMEIARCMTRWICQNQSPATLLDPAIGLGIFFRAFLEKSGANSAGLVGYETDPQIAQGARKMYQTAGYTQVDVRIMDFLESDWTEQFDGILCNPPYRGFRGLPDKPKIVQSILTHTGLNLSQASNLYIFFLVKAIWQLKPGGRAAFILPYEFLNADYGIPIKQMLIDQGVLRRVVILGEALQPFEGVITTSCILCLERSDSSDRPIITTANTFQELSLAMAANDLSDNSEEIQEVLTCRPVPPANQKWVVPEHQLDHIDASGLVHLSTYGQVRRGIATGDNGFFVISEQQRLEAGLGMEHVIPCLAKSAFAPGDTFTHSDFEVLRTAGKPVWLVNLVGYENSQAVKRYLQAGKDRGTDQRYLPRFRNPWYAIESRKPAPLLVTTFSRGQIRWVRNLAGVWNLTAFHGFYPHPGTDIDALHGYLTTAEARELLVTNCRVYGNGLQKYEPNDLNLALIQDIHSIRAA